MDGKRIDKVLAIPKSSALEEVSSGLNQDR
jgi:hypothetical protein